VGDEDSCGRLDSVNEEEEKVDLEKTGRLDVGVVFKEGDVAEGRFAV
jgi:hypothetical protein